MSKERILIVEDEKIISLDLQRRLEKFDYTVVGLCTTGQEAVDKAEELKPDIILMDIMLAGADIDGIDAAKIIKERNQIPVIFLTAYADEKTLNRAKEAEPFGYILKPFKEKELYTTIDIAIYKYQVDKTLKRQERRFSAILHSIADGIIATDKQRNIEFMNPVAEQITGLQEEEAKSLPIASVLKIFDENTRHEIILPDTSSNEEKGTFFFKDAIIKNKSGETIPVEGTVASIRDSQSGIEGQVIAVRDITELREMSNRITYQASHDALTGLLNREAFSQALKTLISNAKKEGAQHALIYLDLDQFKLINDTIGHAAGDELLLETTAIVKNVFRSSDTCARLGGDEFGIVLNNTDQETAHIIAERLQNRLKERRLVWGQTAFNIHSSIGLVVIDETSEDIHSVLAAADDACYIAKDEGGRRIRVYKTSDKQFKKRRGEMQWVTRLTKALEEDRFELYYQTIEPISEQARGSLSEKLEILIRMVDEDGGIIPPIDFLPAAERYNLMPMVDRWVVKTAMDMYKRVNGMSGGKGEKVFAINLSAESMADEHFLEYIQNQLQSTGVAPENFCFEITETVTISNMTTASHFIHELKKIGCTFALDDFGSGFSSFNYLKNMPVDYLKIDGSFVKDMDENTVNSAMVEAINNLGHVMGIETVAEFVRNSTILEKLIALGIDYAQGYEISKPQPLKELIEP